MSRGYTAAVLRRLLTWMLLGLPGIATSVAGAASDTPDTPDVAELLRQGHLELSARLAPEGTVVPGQKMTLVLQVGTDTWFTGGTRIGLPEVPGLVILQTEQFASNASERRGSQDWVLQRWTVDIYPQRAGQFTLPPVRVQVKVNSGDAGSDAEGVLTSPALPFSVTLPASLEGLQHWVAAPEYTVSQQFDRPLDGLQVGDAFEREIVFEASDVMAMMLPALQTGNLPGLGIYPAPPLLDNSNNRGESKASRRERISYVVQAEGNYLLPAEDFFWWDTRRDELQVLSLPATAFSVGPGGTGTADDKPSSISTPVISKRSLLIATVALCLAAALLWLIWRYLPRTAPARLLFGLRAGRQKIQRLWAPALPDRLNPGGSAGE